MIWMFIRMKRPIRDYREKPVGTKTAFIRI